MDVKDVKDAKLYLGACKILKIHKREASQHVTP